MHELTPQILLVGATFLVAGCVKGVTGMGLPTVAIGLLGLLMAPAEAASFLVIPSLVTNVWQFVAGPNRGVLLRRIWPLLLTSAVATVPAVGLIAGVAGAQATAGLGAALALYAAIGLFRFRFRVRGENERWLAPAIGAATGVVAGATGVFAIPAVPYLEALGLAKDDLVQALGLSFTVSTVALALGLASHGVFHAVSAGASALCTAPALAGMFLGQAIRARVDALTFRRIFLVGLLLLGADLFLRSVL